MMNPNRRHQRNLPLSHTFCCREIRGTLATAGRAYGTQISGSSGFAIRPPPEVPEVSLGSRPGKGLANGHKRHHEDSDDS